MSDPIRDKLEAARTSLVLERPFLGVLSLHLPLVAADAEWCPTTATDARAFYYNPDYIQNLDFQGVQFMLAHEALHCGLSHFARRGHRIAARWDAACDLAVNQMLAEDGLTPPAGAVTAPEWAGLAAEEIYPRLGEGYRYQMLDRHLYREGSGGQSGERQNQGTETVSADQPRCPDPLEREQLARQWRQRSARALQQAQQAGKPPGHWLRRVQEALAPGQPWRALLAQWLNHLGRHDYTYLRPARREGPAILPALHQRYLEVVVVLDTSASIGETALAAFAAELDALKGQLPARLTLHACDARLDARGPWVYEPWEPFVPPAGLVGQGGTDFRPAFDWVAEERQTPDGLLYFTDGQGTYPQAPPGYPVLWLLTGGYEVPWGEAVTLDGLPIP